MGRSGSRKGCHYSGAGMIAPLSVQKYCMQPFWVAVILLDSKFLHSSISRLQWTQNTEGGHGTGHCSSVDRLWGRGHWAEEAEFRTRSKIVFTVRSVRAMKHRAANCSYYLGGAGQW